MPRRMTIERATPFGQWLTTARLRRGITMEQLADAADITQAMVSSLERGTRNASRETIVALARALSPEGANEHTSRALLDSGLKARGFTGTGEGLPLQHGDIVRSLIREKRFDDQQFSGEEIEQIATGVASLIGGYIADKREARGEIN